MVLWSEPLGMLLLVGILDGILILLNKGYKWATVQTDYSDVAKALTDKGLEDLGITIFI
ncbi:hypothetical protein Goshw_027623 [Gossypium schwendimanii]|uniref:RNase H type-1 domain-containing protein n=1 Tax=Gossypium schwendimanii TaxID=34291 RepID=A0A7J9MEU7_GOSSC|nr:hypothetical protein [Gossypium schwendimanii]